MMIRGSVKSLCIIVKSRVSYPPKTDEKSVKMKPSTKIMATGNKIILENFFTAFLSNPCIRIKSKSNIHKGSITAFSLDSTAAIPAKIHSIK